MAARYPLRCHGGKHYWAVYTQSASLDILILLAAKYFPANQKQGFDLLLQLVLAPRSTINLVSRVNVFFFAKICPWIFPPDQLPCLGLRRWQTPDLFSSLKFLSYENYVLTRLRLSWSNGWWKLCPGTKSTLKVPCSPQLHKSIYSTLSENASIKIDLTKWKADPEVFPVEPPVSDHPKCENLVRRTKL